MSTSAQQVSSSTTAVERRFYPRIVPQAPIFVAFNESDFEESLLLNVSENGLLVSTPTGLTSNSVARLCLPLNGLPKPVQVTVRVLWASEAANLAGIQLLDLSEHDRQQIRKWGARESAKSWQPNHLSLVVPPSKASFETARATLPLAGGTRVRITRDPVPVPLAPPPVVRWRSTSNLERSVIWGLYLAAASLVAVFFLRSEVLGNLLSHSGTDRSQTNAAAALTQETELTPQTPNLSSRAANSQATPPALIHESITPKRANTTRSSTHQDSAKRVKVPSEAAGDESPAEVQGDPSPNPALPARSDVGLESSSDSAQSPTPAEVPKEAAPEPEAPPSPDPSTLAEPLPNPTRASDAPYAATASIPSSPSLSTPTKSMPTNSIVSSARPSPSPNSDATVIRMDPPRNQTLEVHLPSGHQALFLHFPGERVIELPTMTMHIRRSVLMPASGGGWFANRNKKVVVGELTSRVDPQAAQIPSGSATSVRVKATVTKDGHIENIKLIRGSANLAPAVAKAFREWRYQPTLVDNKPVETQCYVVFQFHAPQYRASKH
jgi:PilZ domain/Gram-negative bacterial TonB protein C-terminal